MTTRVRERRKRGDGCIYQMKGSRFLWIKWYDADGKPHCESTKSENPDVARRLLRARRAKIEAGETVLPKLEKVRYEEAAADLKAYYETTGRRDADEVEKRLTPLKAFFAGRLIRAIGPADVTAYAQWRQTAVTVEVESEPGKTEKVTKPGKANGTINRELAILGKMLRLAARNGKLARVPTIELLQEATPRQGFFEADRFKAVRDKLADRPDLQLVLDIAYAFGWRVRDEILTLTWAQIDLKAGTIRLEPGSTKNRDGRLVTLEYFPEIVAGLQEQRARVKAFQEKEEQIVPFVFPHVEDGPINPKTGKLFYAKGERIRDFRRAWQTACKNAGAPGMLRHDFRRTAARNMERAGVPRTIAMAIIGHKTESVYRRYAIVDERSIAEGTKKLAAFKASQVAAPETIVSITAVGSR